MMIIDAVRLCIYMLLHLKLSLGYYQSIGAVNCVIRRPIDGKLFGCNTDYIGAISAIESGLQGFSYNSSHEEIPSLDLNFLVYNS